MHCEWFDEDLYWKSGRMKLKDNFRRARSIQEMNNHGCRNFLLLDAPNNNYFFVFCSFIEIYLNGYLWFFYSSLTFNVPADCQSRLFSFMFVHISVLPFYLYSSGYCMFYSRQMYKVIDRYFLKWLKIMYVQWLFAL